ncbi:hypothetical protein Ccrd_020679 [Cynara cardunculus var. scolymus]|uniref:Uncharacterized protein ycf72 n=1 Tax=Cynara cardunculus var. scolymus TaxID=59895 RepID=A0A103Y202_CYNCS|nr:hypothetical protein Ccrd_020679 [Cynara cardunculus var. scolymus]
MDIKRTSPKGNFNETDFLSFAISFATAPAALANCPPFPSVISMLCMAVPKGISVEVDSSFLSIKTPSQIVQASSKAYDFLDDFHHPHKQGTKSKQVILVIIENVGKCEETCYGFNLIPNTHIRLNLSSSISHSKL